MKKLIALLLMLTMLLSTAALAETTSFDLGLFTLNADSKDNVTVGTKEEGAVIVSVAPVSDVLDGTDILQLNWTASIISTLPVSVEEFAQLVLDGAIEEMEAQGMTIIDPQVWIAEFDDETSSMQICYSMTIDYSIAKLDMYFYQLYIPIPDDGTYLFTLAGDSLDDIQALLEYIDTHFEVN